MSDKDDKGQDKILEQRALQNQLLQEEKEKQRLLKEDIQQIHDENKADWVRALKSAGDILKRHKVNYSSADTVVVAGQMVVVMTNRRLAQRAVEARRNQMEQASQGGVIRPQFN